MNPVVWTNAARDQLADAYVLGTHDGREDLVKEVLAVERESGTDPLAAGESRDGQTRVLFSTTFVVHYGVTPDLVAVVSHFRPLRPRSAGGGEPV